MQSIFITLFTVLFLSVFICSCNCMLYEGVVYNIIAGKYDVTAKEFIPLTVMFCMIYDISIA